MTIPAPAPAEAPEPRPAERAPFHGWRIVAVGIVAQMLGMGLISAYGVFVVPVATEFSAPMASMGLGYSIFLLTGGLLGPFLGPALDRRSIRAIMLAGVVVMLAGLLLLSRAQALWQAGLALALAVGGMMMYGMLPVHVLLVRWFTLRRGLALSIAALGIGVPGLFVPLLAAELIESVGWRDAIAVLAIGAAVLVAPVLAWLVVGRPSDLGQHPDGLAPPPGSDAAPEVAAPSSGALLRQPNFWFLTAGLGLVFSAALYHGLFLVPFLESLGVPRTRAALVLSVTAVFSIAGKLGVAAIADRVDIRRLIWALLVLQASAWLMLIARPSLSMAFAAGVGFGLGTGALLPLPAMLLSACFGPSIFGRVAGLMSPFRLPFSVAIPWLGGLLIDWSGDDYRLTFGFGVFLLAVSGLILIGVRVPETRPT